SAIVVVAHLHLDHPLELGRILSGLLRALLERRDEGVAVELCAFAARDDDSVALAPGEGRGLRAPRGNEEGDRLGWFVEELRLLRSEVLPLEGHVIVRPELLDELHRLAHAAEALARLRPLRRGERRLVHGFAAADAEEYPPRCEERDGRHRLRDDGWVVAERGRDDARAQPPLPMTLSDIPGHRIPGVRPKGHLVGPLLAAGASAPNKLVDGDVLVVAQKVVSKSEGRIVRLGEVVPGKRALEMAEESGKDARQLEVVLGESKQIVRWARGVLIVETRHGFVCANAGVDR